jgi:hypothetical protein
MGLDAVYKPSIGDAFSIRVIADPVSRMDSVMDEQFVSSMDHVFAVRTADFGNQKPAADDRLTIKSGDYAGVYIVKSIEPDGISGLRLACFLSE